MKPKVSIVIPVYNCEKFISECIESAINQTMNDIEILLIDDGSKDSSKDICMEYAKLDSRIRYIWQKNQGVSSARNKGIIEANSDWIMFLDSDDILDADICFRLYSLTGKADLIVCGYTTFQNDISCCSIPLKCKNFSGNIEKFVEVIDAYLNPPILLGPCFKLFRKHIIIDNKIEFPLDMAYGEDAVFVMNYLFHCSEITCVDYLGYYYRKGISTSLSSKLEKALEANDRINNLLYQLLTRCRCSRANEIYCNRTIEYTVSFVQACVKNKGSITNLYNTFYGVCKKENFRNVLKYCKVDSIGKFVVIAAYRCKLLFPMLLLFKLK